MVRKYTIKDIAKKAGVSVSTVSRAINNTDDINKETKKRIKEIIKELNYNPNPAAKALVGRSSNYIAIIVPNIHHSVISKMVQGIMTKLEEEKIDVLLLDYNERREKEEHYCSIIDQKMIDGLIMITSIAKSEDIVAISKKIPTVLIERMIDSNDVDSVFIDEESGMYQLLKHLKNNGHSKIGFINGARGTTSAEIRMKTYLSTMKKLDLIYYEDCVLYTNWSLLGGKEAFIKLMNSKCECTALVCASDQLAMGAIGAAYKLGISVPKDISILGFDNFDDGLISIPPLTTLDFPAFKMGEAAAECILERIKDGRIESKNIILPVSLIERDSVKSIK